MRCRRFVCLLVTIGLLALFSDYVDGAEIERRTITVTSAAEVTAEADFAVLDFGVLTLNASLSQARRENDERVRKVLTCLREFEIDPSDVQTSQVWIWPEFRQYGDPSTLYYRYWKGFRVVLRKLDHFELVFNSVLEAGANQVDSVLFKTTRRDALEKEARDAAVAKAKDKAAQLAHALGQKLGRPREINHSDDLYPDYGYEDMGVPIDDSEPTFAEGQITVKSAVRITFELLEDDSQ